MNNSETRAAWDYHEGTKHPSGRLMDPGHIFDPTRRPLLFKIYRDLQPIPLPMDGVSPDVPALSAISANVALETPATTLDIQVLARILHHSAGITKKIAYPQGEVMFRAAACTGALYHIELYVACGDMPGLQAGVYHYEPHRMALTRLRDGDYRGVLVDATGREPHVARSQAVLAYTDVVWRNACKYQAREYRHAFWDSGTVLSNTLAVAAAYGIPAQVVAGFVDAEVVRLLGLDGRREVPVALVPLGRSSGEDAGPPPDVGPLALETVPISDREEEFPAILDIHRASALPDGDEVAAWRQSAGHATPGKPRGRLFPLRPEDGQKSADPLEEVVVRRGSTRRFSREAITFADLSLVLSRAMQGTPADFIDPPGAALCEAYLIVNDVDGLPRGAYVYHRDRSSLELLKEGGYRPLAGHLGLDQALAADASVDIFLMAELGPILERLGNRGYRAAQLDAGVTAGRIYLASYAQRLGATGLTFFDDAVTDFFLPHSVGKSPMFLIAVGKKAPRRSQ